MSTTPVPVSKVCAGSQCGKTFNTTNDSDLCYDCTLQEIIGDMPPEEGDFNTAKIRSGTMTSQERDYLQQDLRHVENGTSSFEPDDDIEWLDDDYDDDWEYDEEADARFGHEG